jgi:hypothetical protein
MVSLREFLTTYFHAVALDGRAQADPQQCLSDPESIYALYTQAGIQTQIPIADSVHWLLYWAAQTPTRLPQVYGDNLVTPETAAQAVELVTLYEQYVRQSFPAVPLPGTPLPRRETPPRAKAVPRTPPRIFPGYPAPTPAR